MTSNPIRKRPIAYPRNGRLSLSQLSVIVTSCVLFCLPAAKGQQGPAATPPWARTTNEAVPKTWSIFFTSNMFGSTYVFSVEVDKSPPSAIDVFSTPELAQRFSPKPPPTPYDEQW